MYPELRREIASEKSPTTAGRRIYHMVDRCAVCGGKLILEERPVNYGMQFRCEKLECPYPGKIYTKVQCVVATAATGKRKR